MGRMNRSTRMLLMRDNSGRSNNGSMNYGPEDRFHDRRGREHYDNGRYAPVRNESEYGGEMRYGYGKEMRGNYGGDYDMESRRGRRRGARSEHEGMMGEEEYWPPYSPPVYETGSTMNRIGFDQPRNVMPFPMGNMGGRSGSMEMANRPRSSEGFSKEDAEEWVMAMQNEDGTKGPHWKFEDVQRLMKQRGIKHDPYEFWAVLNGVYSDYCAVAKKHGVNTMDFYVDFANAWINDKDAVPNKTAMYYECITK